MSPSCPAPTPDPTPEHADRRVVPLAGPLGVEPLDLRRDALPRADFAGDVNPAGALARAMLDAALDGVVLGSYDQRIITWLKDWDAPTVATLASILRRAWTAGTDVGRAERVDEVPTVQTLRVQLHEHQGQIDRLQELILDLQAALAAHRDDTKGGPR